MCGRVRWRERRKANGSQSSVNALVNTLNAAALAKNVEVVVAPPALYAVQVAKALRPDIGVAAQDVNVQVCMQAHAHHALVRQSDN